MGSGPSTESGDRKKSKSLQIADLKKNEKEIIRLMMPVYYSPEDINPTERKLAQDAWQLILDDKSPAFLAQRGTPGFEYQSCVTFFYDSFYTRLFDIHPLSRQLFKNGMKSQGKFLVKMISLALSELDDPHKFDLTLIKLAEIHYQRGVKSVECKYNYPNQSIELKSHSLLDFLRNILT